MAEEYKTYTCKYKAEWPVDRYGRLGGMYSLADLSQGYVEMEREGKLLAKDSKRSKCTKYRTVKNSL